MLYQVYFYQTAKQHILLDLRDRNIWSSTYVKSKGLNNEVEPNEYILVFLILKNEMKVVKPPNNK